MSYLILWLAVGLLVYPWAVYRYWKTGNQPETVMVRYWAWWCAHPWKSLLTFLLVVSVWPVAIWNNR